MVRVSTVVFAAVSIAAVTAAPAYIHTAEGVLPARDVLPADGELQGRGLKVDLLEKRRLFPHWHMPNITGPTGPSPPTIPSGNTKVPPTAAHAKVMGKTSSKVKGKTISKPGRKSSMKQRREVENELQARSLFQHLLPHPLPRPHIPLLPHIAKRPSGNAEVPPTAAHTKVMGKTSSKVKGKTISKPGRKSFMKQRREVENELQARSLFHPLPLPGPHPLPYIPWLPHIAKRPSGDTEATPSAGARAKVKATTGHTTSKKQKQKRESEAEHDLYLREVELLQEREPFLPLLL